jgi:hypothetical protein
VRGSEIVLCGEMLTQRRQQRIPALITDGRRLVAEKRGLNTG